jgi:hypothetical protein
MSSCTRRGKTRAVNGSLMDRPVGHLGFQLRSPQWSGVPCPFLPVTAQ